MLTVARKKFLSKLIFNRNTMKAKALGIVLIIIGLLMIVYTGFNIITTKKVVDLGPIQINKEKNHPVEWPPVVGAIILVGGIMTLVVGRKIHT